MHCSAGASNLKSLTLAIKQAEKGKANPISEGKIPIWPEFSGKCKILIKVKKLERLAMLAKFSCLHR